jgi:hypothetical protein
MKSQALQEFIRAIFGDENTRQQFLSDPSSVVSRYTLTEEEKKAALGTYFKVGLITRNSSQLEAEINPLGFWF